jgi:hypothetical protein
MAMFEIDGIHIFLSGGGAVSQRISLVSQAASAICFSWLTFGILAKK